MCYWWKSCVMKRQRQYKNKYQRGPRENRARIWILREWYQDWAACLFVWSGRGVAVSTVTKYRAVLVWRAQFRTRLMRRSIGTPDSAINQCLQRSLRTLNILAFLCCSFSRATNLFNCTSTSLSLSLLLSYPPPPLFFLSSPNDKRKNKFIKFATSFFAKLITIVFLIYKKINKN